MKGPIRLKQINRDRHKKHDTSTRLSSNRALSTRSLETWNPFPLSPVCNPYYKLFSASNMSSSHGLDVGAFCPNQYKPCVFLAHHPSQTRNNTNLLVGGNSKHRHYCFTGFFQQSWFDRTETVLYKLLYVEMEEEEDYYIDKRGLLYGQANIPQVQKITSKEEAY